MKKLMSIFCTLLISAGLLAACAPAASSSVPVSSAAPSSSASVPDEVAATDMRIAGLKGPTSMGMVKLMQEAEEGSARHNYQVEMYGKADEVTAKLINGDLDIAAVPANVASVLYNKTEGKVQVAAINTLGVLYVVQTGDAVKSFADLKGKTIYSTGQGQTPEFVLNYLLQQNGIDPEKDVTVEYKAEATEVAALLAEATDAIAVLPQPYATAVQVQNEKVSVALNLTEEWDKVSPDSALVTGVLVVRTEFAEQNKEAFVQFLEDYKASIDWVNANVADAAELVAQFGIVEKAPIAQKALPLCNIVYIDGEPLQQKLEGYLGVLFAEAPESVGGALPDAGFYFAA